MKRLTFLLLISILAFAPIIVAAENSTSQQHPENAVIITYSRAVELALSNMIPNQQADIYLRELRNMRDDLQTHIINQERRQVTRETQDLINDMQDNLWGLDWQISGAVTQQQQLQAVATAAMEEFIQSMGTGIVDTNALQTAITSMIWASSMDMSIGAMQDGRSQIGTTIDDINALRNPARYVIDNNRRDLTELERQIEALNLTQENAEIAQENALRQTIIAVEELSLAISVTQATIGVSEESLRQAEVLHSFGMMSINDIRMAEQALARSQMALTELTIRFDSAMQHLNHMLHQPLNQHTVIEFERDLPEIPENIARHITQTATSTQIVRQLQLQVETARYARRTFDETRDRERRANQSAGRAGESETVRRNNDRTRDALQESYNLAVATLAQATQSLQTAMHNAYNDVDRLHTQKEIQAIELSTAITLFETVLTNFELGRATAHEVEQARLNVFISEQAMETTLNQKWLLTFMLENPVLLI